MLELGALRLELPDLLPDLVVPGLQVPIRGLQVLDLRNLLRDALVQGFLLIVQLHVVLQVSVHQTLQLGLLLLQVGNLGLPLREGVLQGPHVRFERANLLLVHHSVGHQLHLGLLDVLKLGGPHHDGLLERLNLRLELLDLQHVVLLVGFQLGVLLPHLLQPRVLLGNCLLTRVVCVPQLQVLGLRLVQPGLQSELLLYGDLQVIVAL